MRTAPLNSDFLAHALGHCAYYDLVVRDLYALSSNDATKLADWVGYRLTVSEVAGEAESRDLERAWRMDPWLDAAETLDPDPPGPGGDPYTRSGYQRGHLAPLAAFVGSPAAPTVNVFSNIVPQRGGLNGGPWEGVEAAVRGLVLRRAALAESRRPAGHRGFPDRDDRAAVWVLSGPLYERPMPPLQTDVPHAVPSAFWTVVAVMDGWGPDGLRVAAFAFDQDAYFPDPLDNLTTVDDVERRSGLDLFPRLPDAVAAPLEAAADRDAARALLFPDD